MSYLQTLKSKNNFLGFRNIKISSEELKGNYTGAVYCLDKDEFESVNMIKYEHRIEEHKNGTKYYSNKINFKDELVTGILINDRIFWFVKPENDKIFVYHIFLN